MKSQLLRTHGLAYLGWFVVVVGLIACAGCGTFVGKHLVREVRGGQHHLVIIENPGPADLLDYRTVTFELFSNQVGDPLAPQATQQVRKAYAASVLKHPRLYSLSTDQSDPRTTLLVRGSIIHYQKPGRLSSIMGGFSQLICRVDLIDSSTNRVLGRANCISYSKALYPSGGMDELSEESARAFRKWLTQEHSDSTKE